MTVISFAGHGSPDGSMVLFGTDAANPSASALLMAELADASKATRPEASCAFSIVASVARRRLAS